MSVKNKIDWKKHKNPMIDQKNLRPAPGNDVLKSVDYLGELRKKREKDEQMGIKRKMIFGYTI